MVVQRPRQPVVPGGIVGPDPGEAEGEGLEPGQPVHEPGPLPPPGQRLLRRPEPLGGLDETAVLALGEVEGDPGQASADLGGEVPHRLLGVDLVGGPPVADPDRRPHPGDDGPPEHGLPGVRQAHGDDPEVQRPSGVRLRGQRDAGGARPEGLERRLVVADPLRVDLDRLPGPQRLDGAPERLLVVVHPGRVVLAAVYGEAVHGPQDLTDARLMEQRRLGQRSGGAAGDPEDDERIQQAVRVVRDHEDGPGRQGRPDALDRMERGSHVAEGPGRQPGKESRGTRRVRCHGLRGGEGGRICSSLTRRAGRRKRDGPCQGCGRHPCACQRGRVLRVARASSGFSGQ